MPKAFTTVISKKISTNVRRTRWDRGWSMQDLSLKLHDHRCDVHPSGFEMSVQVINAIENGVAPQHGYTRRVRPVTADELHVFSEVFGLDAAEMMTG